MRAKTLTMQLKNLLGGRALFDQPASSLTTWRVGGPVCCVARVSNLRELIAVHELLCESQVPYMALGVGSNLLFADSGYAGVLISLQDELAAFSAQNQMLVAGGGARLSQLLPYAAAMGLQGLEWAAGIPASIGGAVAMNAGSLGNDMAGILENITLLLADGKLLELTREYLPRAGYRHGALPEGSLLLQATIRLCPGKPDDIAANIKANLAGKQELFPLNQANAGSVFKNPPGDFAGRLIEAAGLKGCRLGNAQISAKHANFIVNLGGANADDICGLMQLVRNKVQEKFSIELQPEIIMVSYGDRAQE